MAVTLAVGIQARSTSTRLPGKSFLTLEGGKSITEHVIDRVRAGVGFLQERMPIDATIYLLHPEGDQLADTRFPGVVNVAGPELDVLERYNKMVRLTYPDYILRITGDCPLIPEFVIGSACRWAIRKGLDFCTNTFNETRTAPDGWDVEIMSLKMFQWLYAQAENDLDREHVTYLIRRRRPTEWPARIGHIIGHVDLSWLKISVDTEDDYKYVRNQYTSIQKKLQYVDDIGDLYLRL